MKCPLLAAWIENLQSLPRQSSFILQQQAELFLMSEVVSEKKLGIAIVGFWNRSWAKLAEKGHPSAQAI